MCDEWGVRMCWLILHPVLKSLLSLENHAKRKKKKKSTSRKANHRVFYNLLLFSAPLLAMDAAFITVKGYRNEFHV